MGKPNKFDGLMHDVCVGWGFCGCVSDAGEPRHVRYLIPSQGAVTAQQFAEWVVQADWPYDYEDPRYEPYRKKWVAQIAQLFVKHMGAEMVDATNLKSGEEQ